MTTTTVGKLEVLVRDETEKVVPLLRIASKTGVFMFLSTHDALNNEALFWPNGALLSTTRWALGLYTIQCEADRKRPIILRGRVEPGYHGRPLKDAIEWASTEIMDRVAMRAINAPLQVISDGVWTTHWDAQRSGRLIHCTKTADRLEYRAPTKVGAQAMVSILLSSEVRHMLLNKDHYSRVRRTGED